MRFMLCTSLAVCWIAVVGCKSASNKYVPPPAPKVTVAQPVTREVTDYADYTGNAKALETVDLRARVEGYLTQVNYQAGTVVKKGDVLFVIDPQPYELAVQQAQAELDARKAQLKLQEATLKQYTEARATGAATEFEILQAAGNVDAAKAAVLGGDARLKRAQLDLSYCKVLAPFDGLINRSQVDVGNLVGAGEKTVLATIVRYDPIYAYFSISENDLLDYMRVSQTRGNGDRGSGLPVMLGLADEQGFPHVGKVDSAENRLDPGTGTITIRGIFPNADRSVVSGLFVRVRLPMARQRALLVPDAAILTDQGGQFVLSVNDSNVVEQHRVVTGKLFGDLREVQQGLTGKEWVVINGIQRARPGSTVSPTRQQLPATAPAETATSAPASRPAAPSGPPKGE